MLINFCMASSRETNSALSIFPTARMLLSSAFAVSSSAMLSSTNATISFCCSRSAISLSIFSDRSVMLPMIIRQAVMIATEAKDMKPCVLMLRKPSRIR